MINMIVLRFGLRSHDHDQDDIQNGKGEASTSLIIPP